jgi:hypothetical protein
MFGRDIKRTTSPRSTLAEELVVSSNAEKNDSTESSPINLSFPRPLYLSPQASTSDLSLANDDPDLNVRLRSVRITRCENDFPLRRCDSYQSESGSNINLRDRASLADEENSSSSRTTKSTKEPQLSWQLTCMLLILVTVVSSLCLVKLSSLSCIHRL